MELQDVLQAISTLGFPVAMCIWFMFIDHKDSKYMTEALNKLTTMIELMVKTNKE